MNNHKEPNQAKENNVFKSEGILWFESIGNDNMSGRELEMGLSTINSITSTSSHYVPELYEGETFQNAILSGDTSIDHFEKFSTFPLFFEKSTFVLIPKKVKRVLERYVSRAALKDIDGDVDTAIELCLIFLANLSNSFYLEKKWKSLHSSILDEQVGHDNKTYLKIRELLEMPLSTKGAIIEVNHKYTIGERTKQYKLSDNYYGKGVELYELKTEYAKELRRKAYFKALNKAINNPIANSQINLYAKMTLPTKEEIMQAAKKLVKEKYRNKKGKLLTFRNKHTDDYWVDFEDRVFVEHNIDLYSILTDNGLMIPTVGEENAGGRVTDSITLMPSWIRNLIKINGRPIVECDYTALHPNLAINIYRGGNKYITHQMVANELRIEKNQAKIEHLSFFNKEWKSMANSVLFKYYNEKEPQMMQNLFFDKKENGHKSTSRKMFTLEVQIMTEVIKELRTMGITVGYVYDALFCTEQDREKVLEIMNKKVLDFNVYTSAK